VNYYCIADEDTVRGFRLAGVAGEPVTTPDQAAMAVQQAAAKTDIGILILTEAVADGIREQVEALRMNRDRPLIVEIPGPGGPRPGGKDLEHLVREAVGVPLDSMEAMP